ncbi:MAG: flagellar hook basal-body protein [Myxococcales bacterium]|nr:flagellar hook basal-body protein [Myxococcales bacterium]
MASGIYIAMTGAKAQQDALDVTSSNIANASTVGYKAERITFQKALAQAASQDSAFVAATTGATDERPGELIQTDNPLDLALVGDGWFSVDTPNGVRYTRAGNFRLDPAGTIVNADGHAARATGGGTIVVPAGAAQVAVGADGTVSVDGQLLGGLELSRFAPGDLGREGASLFVANTAPSAVAPGELEVVSGALEGSNFEIIRGMIDLVKVSRSYEALHRMIESYRQLDERTARSIGGPG